MNLIEQYGGYAKAKALVNSVNDGSTACFIDGCFCSKEALNLLMLEYRREHKIYEVGDYVVHPMFKSVFVVDNVFKDHVYATNKSGYRTKLSNDVIKHATDEEIKQGYRDNIGKRL